jgi:hypothetical protein
MEPMTDQQLAGYLNLSPDEAAIVLPKITPGKRALYDRMRQVEVEAELWVCGLGPKPKDVLIDTVRGTRRRSGWR